MFLAWLLYSEMVLGFAASNIALGVMFWHMRHKS